MSDETELEVGTMVSVRPGKVWHVAYAYRSHGFLFYRVTDNEGQTREFRAEDVEKLRQSKAATADASKQKQPEPGQS